MSRYTHGHTRVVDNPHHRRVSYQKPSDANCPLPEDGSHSQGNHPAEYAPRPTVNPAKANRREDSRHPDDRTM